jgi:hypothetical protein
MLESKASLHICIPLDFMKTTFGYLRLRAVTILRIKELKINMGSTLFRPEERRGHARHECT